MKRGKKGIKSYICKHCQHVVWYDAIDKVWRHKNMLHNDNCECRTPEGVLDHENRK